MLISPMTYHPQTPHLLATQTHHKLNTILTEYASSLILTDFLYSLYATANLSVAVQQKVDSRDQPLLANSEQMDCGPPLHCSALLLSPSVLHK